MLNTIQLDNLENKENNWQIKDLELHPMSAVLPHLNDAVGAAEGKISEEEAGGNEQVYYDFTKLGSFIWSGSYDGMKFITYPASNGWKATLNVKAFDAYLASLFQQMKEGGMNQIDLCFSQLNAIDALVTGNYSSATPSDVLIQTLKSLQGIVGPDGKSVNFLKLYIDGAHAAGIKVRLTFGGANANATTMKIAGQGETAEGQAEKLAEFMNEYGIDSVGFDIETAAFSEVNTPTQQRAFFEKLHSLLAPEGKTTQLTVEGSVADWPNRYLKALFYGADGSKIFGQLFDHLNLMLYSSSKYYIDANNPTWGIEEWLNIIGKENASKISIGFEDAIPYENPNASAGEKYKVDPNSRGDSAAMIYLQLLAQLKKDGYPTDLGSPFWWPDEGKDNYNPNEPNSVISKTMIDFYQYLESHSS